MLLKTTTVGHDSAVSSAAWAQLGGSAGLGWVPSGIFNHLGAG